VDIKLENRDGQPSRDTEGISILANDVTRVISRLHRIRIIATAGDPESRITNFALATAAANDGQGVLKSYNLSWACAGTGEITGILELATMTTTPPLTLPGPQELSQINVTVDPVGQASCSTKTLDGFIRVVATNGAGQTVSSKTFHFEFIP
jgi:hypothetical protein